MKYHYLIFALLVSSCSLIPSKFDSSLYDRLIVLDTDINNAIPNCGKDEFENTVHNLKYQTDIIEKYSEYTSQDINTVLTLVDKDITQMDNIYKVGKPSQAYCDIKLKIINNELVEILTGIGRKQK